MTIQLPQNNKWIQNNKSDLSGSIYISKNINLDEDGYIKLSPRMVSIFSEDDDGDFATPEAIGVSNITSTSTSNIQVATTDDHFYTIIGKNTFSILEDGGSGNPNGSSGGTFWQNRWYVAESTSIVYKDADGIYSAVWSNAITGLSGGDHPIALFKSKNSLAVGIGNTVKLYDTSHSNTVTLTLQAGETVRGLLYNNRQLGIITTLDSDSIGQDGGAYFYVWDGASSEASNGVGIGSKEAITIFPYAGTFGIVTQEGQIRIWNGGGFTDDLLESFPYYYQNSRLISDVFSTSSFIDGGNVYFNMGNRLLLDDKKESAQLQQFPAGVWCSDKDYGLYHRYSPSISKATFVDVLTGGSNTSTDVLTANSGTIPATGSIARYIDDSGDPIGGLTQGEDYYIIKLTSSTFKLATSKANAETGIAIDITTQSGSTAYFYMYELLDYGQTYVEDAGAMEKMHVESYFNGELILGADLVDEGLNKKSNLCIPVPGLKNIGYTVFPKIKPVAKRDKIKYVTINHTPLKGEDKIIVKYKPKEVYGLPTVAPNVDKTKFATWTSNKSFYTTIDLSEAKTYFDLGEEFHLECEIVGGAGAGQSQKIDNITVENGTYVIDFEEEMDGVSSADKSCFIVDNWKVSKTVDVNNQQDGIANFPVENISNTTDIKVELQGSGVKFRLLNLVDTTHEKMV